MNQESLLQAATGISPKQNLDPESGMRFVKIANVYGLLKVEATCEQYDYTIVQSRGILERVIECLDAGRCE